MNIYYGNVLYLAPFIEIDPIPEIHLNLSHDMFIVSVDPEKINIDSLDDSSISCDKISFKG